MTLNTPFKALGPICGLAACMFGGTVLADPLPGAAAQALLYAPDQVEIAVYDASMLSQQERDAITQVARMQQYYGALALAPDEGISGAAVLAGNFHDTASARSTALAECNAKRSGGRACVIVLEVRPAGWEQRALQLNAVATEAFTTSYMTLQAPRAFAVSDTTPGWGSAGGEAAVQEALDQCAEAGATDCRIVSAD